MTKRQLLARITFWIMVATLGSRMLGFLREVQLAYYFGLSDMRGAYTVAFKIPNLIRTLVADAAISAAFIPVFTEYLLKNSKENAWKIASQMINGAFLALTFIVVICEIFMPEIIQFTTPGYLKNIELFNHTVSLSRIIFPIITILGVGGIFVGILHSTGHFTSPALAPIFWNMVNISAVFLLHKQLGIYSAAWGLLGATAVMLLVQVWPFFSMNWKYYFRLGLKDPTMQQIGFLMIPVTLSIGVININALVDNYFASHLGPSAVAAIDSAFRLFQLPQGLFAIAIGTVLFPTLSKYVAKNEMDSFSKTLSFGIREIFFITLPFVSLFMVLSLPIARFCFERGAFLPQDSELVSKALIFFSIGMSFTAANTLLNRGFYSLKKTWIPLYVGIVTIGLNVFCDWLFIKFWGHAGICLSTSVVSIFNFFALTFLMKKQAQGFNVSEILTSLVKLPLAALTVAISSYVIWTTLDLAMGRTFLAQAGALTGAFILSFLVYIGVSYLFKFNELRQSISLLKKR